MYLLLLAVIYLAFVGLGLPDSLLGSAWPTVRAELGVPISYMGIISMIIAFGTVVSGILSERLIKKFKAKTIVIVSTILSGVAMIGFSFANNMYLMCLWAIPYGLSAGAIDAALNNYVASHYSSRHMSWLHCFWGVGTIISPYIMSYALVHFRWADGYRIVAALQLVIAAVLVLTLPLWRVNKNKEDAENEAAVLGLRGVLKIKGVPQLLSGFFCYCAAEATAMLWTSSYMESVRGASKEEAAALGALFYLGMTIGRFFAGFIADKVGDNRMIKSGTAFSFLGVIAILLPFKTAAIAGFIIFGLGCAPIYPCIIHATPQNFGAENSQGIIGIQMASAYIGMTFMPPLFGLIANHISLKLMPIYLAIFMILLLVMISKTERICNTRRKTND